MFFNNFNKSLIKLPSHSLNISRKHIRTCFKKNLKFKLGVGSTWVMFAGLMSPYDLDVFLLH